MVTTLALACSAACAAPITVTWSTAREPLGWARRWRAGLERVGVEPALARRLRAGRRRCSAYGSSVLILPEASLDAVHVNASLCTQGDLNEALLYATVSVEGTHAALWTIQ
jgi:hypothetical protein